MYDFVDILRMLAVTSGQKLHLIHLLQLNFHRKSHVLSQFKYLIVEDNCTDFPHNVSYNANAMILKKLIEWLLIKTKCNIFKVSCKVARTNFTFKCFASLFFLFFK